MAKESKLIRLDQEVYDELDEIRLKRETFSNAVWRLLRLNEQMRKMLMNLGGQLPKGK